MEANESSGSESDHPSVESDHKTTSSVSSSPISTSEMLVSNAKSSLAEANNLKGLYTEHVAAKIWRVARELLDKDNTLKEYPEFVSESGPRAGRFSMKPVRFWTCGFFPGSLYCILERCIKFPKALGLSPSLRSRDLLPELFDLCQAWSAPLREMAKRTDTHDLGFITQPALRADWEMRGNSDSFKSLVTAAHNLASRWSDEVGAIRSWDETHSKSYDIIDKEKNFLIIVDSMCNLDLLYYIGHHTNDQSLIYKATSHAQMVLQTLVRDDFSTYHVANLDPRTGKVQKLFTHQGYSDSSTWARGQAWCILGFTQTYAWTRKSEFLDAAIQITDRFLARLAECEHKYRYVPPWDFDAPKSETVLRDSSAGMIAANGMLLLYQILIAQGELQSSKDALPSAERYLKVVRNILHDTWDYCLRSVPDHNAVTFELQGKTIQTVSSAREEDRWDSILVHATANNNGNALVQYSDHGLVYADYYFLELGNKLLRMGLA